MKFKYRVESFSENTFKEIESPFGIEDGDLEYVAEDAAEDFYNSYWCGGMEDDLPDITLYTLDGQRLGTFEIESNYSRSFSAYPKE